MNQIEGMIACLFILFLSHGDVSGVVVVVAEHNESRVDSEQTVTNDWSLFQVNTYVHVINHDRDLFNCCAARMQWQARPTNINKTCNLRKKKPSFARKL